MLSRQSWRLTQRGLARPSWRRDVNFARRSFHWWLADCCRAELESNSGRPISPAWARCNLSTSRGTGLQCMDLFVSDAPLLDWENTKQWPGTMR